MTNSPQVTQMITSKTVALWSGTFSMTSIEYAKRKTTAAIASGHSLYLRQSSGVMHRI